MEEKTLQERIVDLLVYVMLAWCVIYGLWVVCHVWERLADAAEPVTVTAQDVMLPKGGADYTVFHGHAANQFERDAMEETLANVYLPQVVAYMRAMGKPCSSYMSNAWSQIPVIYRRLAAVNQYRGGALRGNTWQVTPGGRYYQIEHYQMVHAQQCSLGSGADQCAVLLASNPDLLTLLNLRIDGGACVLGAVVTPVVEPAQSASSLDGLVSGKQMFPVLDAASEAALATAEHAHMASMCGQPPFLDAAGVPVNVKKAQDVYIRLGRSIAESHFRMPPPFKGGCDPLWSQDECCRWKALEHREYTNWARAERLGRWGEADCFGMRHNRMHDCANLWGPYEIRMPPCVFGTYPDDTLPVTCQAYLAAQAPPVMP